MAATAAAAAPSLGGCASPALTDASPPTRLAAGTAGGRASSDELAPFGWASAAVPAGPAGLALAFADDRPIAAPARLRITAATGAGDDLLVAATLARTGRAIGTLDVRRPYPLQPFDLALSAPDAEAARREGVTLRATGGPGPWRIFVPPPPAAASGSSSAARVPPALLPQLLVGRGTDPAAELRDRLASLDSIQPFGWMAGCVLDAQHDLFVATGEERFRQATGQHLRHLLSVGGGLPFAPGSTLPVATIARARPGDPTVDQALAFWRGMRDGGATSVIGAYAIAYPMAVVARQRDDRALTAEALRQLTVRLSRLVRGGDVYYRYSRATTETAGGPPTSVGKNSARGMAWWMLGLARTLAEVPPADRPTELVSELARTAARAKAARGSDGLWPGVLDDPAAVVETSGSAGIAAAMAIGAKAGLLSPEYTAVARKAHAGLRAYLAPDGHLSGVAPPDAEGNSPIADGYRVIAPFATGLMGQLAAALQPGVGRG